MSFDPKNELSSDQDLRVQQLDIRGDDQDMYLSMVGTPIITQDPFMASAGNYGALGASAITNTGATVINGDLGISPGNSITGFPPGTYTGELHVADADAAQAQLDALAAFVALSALPGYVTIPSALDGQTLTAGNYEFASGAATLANAAPGTLTFSGSATDVFVVKTASTLTTGAGGAATVALAGGALAKNIYWVIGSSATLNISGTSTHRGNVIADQSITLTSGGTSVVQGSLIALNAAITFSAATTVTAVSAETSSPSVDLIVLIREPVEKVYLAQVKDDSANNWHEYAQADISIVDSDLIRIASNTAANPTIVTTSSPHNLSEQDQIQITDSNSTPSLDGLHFISVINPYQFALPISVSVAGTAGSFQRTPDSDKAGIRLNTLPGSALAANDLITVRYSTLNHA